MKFSSEARGGLMRSMRMTTFFIIRVGHPLASLENFILMIKGFLLFKIKRLYDKSNKKVLMIKGKLRPPHAYKKKSMRPTAL